MKELSRKYGTYDRQKELLDMIIDIDQLFRDNNIEYSLCGGTLLGAVRENGFIPWDDDIDIMVNRENYEKVVRLFRSSETDYQYALTRKLWIDRIQLKKDINAGDSAATIDVFVMDNCPDSAVSRRFKVFIIKALQGMMKEKQEYEGRSLPQKACLWATHIMGVPFSDETKFRWYQKVAMFGNNKPTRYITGYTDLYKTLSLRYDSNLFKSISRHKFEDTELPITSEFDSYLRTQYGDYMTPPKEEDRIPIHSD